MATITNVTSYFLCAGWDPFWILLLCWPVNETNVLFDIGMGSRPFSSIIWILCRSQRVWTGSRLNFNTIYFFYRVLCCLDGVPSVFCWLISLTWFLNKLTFSCRDREGAHLTHNNIHILFLLLFFRLFLSLCCYSEFAFTYCVLTFVLRVNRF